VLAFDTPSKNVVSEELLVVRSELSTFSALQRDCLLYCAILPGWRAGSTGASIPAPLCPAAAFGMFFLVYLKAWGGHAWIFFLLLHAIRAPRAIEGAASLLCDEGGWCT